MNVYLDHAATTPVDPRVLDAMMPWFATTPGNANSTHKPGRVANVAVEEAREKIAQIINCEPAEIVFTSGGTESNNSAINGAALGTRKNHFITSSIEHHAVLHPIQYGRMKGYTSTILNPNSQGIINPSEVADAITEDTALVSFMHVNNEVGSINPIEEIGAICEEKGVLFHSDTVQSCGKLNVDVKQMKLNFLSMSAHKIYGPKGIGVLFVKNGTPWFPWMQGGSQERKRRGGTLNVPGIIGLAKALELAVEERSDLENRYKSFRSQIIDGLKTNFGDQIIINGDSDNGVPHILNMTFLNAEHKPLDGEMLLFNLDIEGIAVSSGSACTSGALEASHVLRGIGIDNEVAKSSVRLSLGKANTQEEIDYTIQKINECVNRMIQTTV